MKRKYILGLIVAFITLIVIVSCSKRVYPYNKYALLKSTPSKINKFERHFSSDTSAGIFSGIITKRDSSMSGINIIRAFGAMILTFDSITKKIVKGVPSDFDGEYSLYVNPGIYQFEVRDYLKNRLIIKGVSIEAGEKIMIDALLGEGSDSTIYEVKDYITLINTYTPQR